MRPGPFSPAISVPSGIFRASVDVLSGLISQGATLRILFIAGGSPATVFALAPLAMSARNAGHQVFMASNEDMMPVTASIGLAGVPVTSRSVRYFMDNERAPGPDDDVATHELSIATWFARMAAASMDALLVLAERWRPDLVVGGTLCYAAPLLAAHVGIPFVRQAWDTADASGVHAGAEEELRPLLARLGLTGLPEADLFIDICPPSLRPPGAGPARMMRFIPANQQRRVEPWMYTRPERSRVCVTSGSAVTRRRTYDQSYAFLRELSRSISLLDVETIVAAPEEVAVGLRPELRNVRAGWVPLDVVAPTCDLVVHHAGGVTGMTAMNAGVPQLLIPRGAAFVAPAQRVADFGAAITLPPGAQTPDRIAVACRELLSDPSYRARAQVLSQEIAALPPPAELVRALEKLPG
jgi:UDP:flavonoid glycosyltransferase YjiC (YdhE family)